ncbi:pyridoxal phosphate-dependent aminotransferase [Pseudodesulfovibrio thermohalotolerans]|uniref:pyridoxal phosphate-dependent aminotransferase n=1 Tax=Pseudodesulfovibrio thermohalotolerans TaxID=2880651 RepID=UPI002441BFB2|nr:pyridoxal phosphate-dependent aminotransferase [Pseudodesulfovibrio thermohalotolerans]WFS62071.1 pyridoxal phosphate-dependent aminotransferase [Pseudodesulfovibrio thermohalotolerans]
MQLISSQIAGYMTRSSWIRKMFEEGIALKKQFGEDAVCDFSLGNPDLPPPAAIKEGLLELAQEADKPFFMGYMPNFGYPDVREKLAAEVSREQGTPVPAESLVITCGAAGALNSFFRAVLEPGDEVITPAPFFVEYGFYCENHGAKLTPVPAKPLTFQLDLEAMDKAISDKTRVVMLNSPNNPSGAVYDRASLEGLAAILEKHNEGRERPIYILADEPYRFLAFDGVEVPSLLPIYKYSVVCSSFSKNLSMAGERIGYALINPAMEDMATLVGGVVLANRILGFVNAPALAQKLMARALGSGVDISIYDRRRKAMAEVLDSAGYEYTMPKGAFYFFPKAPGGDDVKFCAALQEEKILAVPGSGFGYPGFFRLSFSVEDKIIPRSREGFAAAMAKFK